jgi:hypothetical protein
MNLARDERTLRAYDKALRVRRSVQGDLILVERKTSRGRIGSTGPDGISWTPDIGRRHEEGHVLVTQIGPERWSTGRLLEWLQRADTWRQPGWIDKIEHQDQQAKAAKVRSRQQDMRYRATQLWDNYVWRNKQRVAT